MKKILFALLLSSPCLAGTISTYGTLMQITYSSAAAVVSGGGATPSVIQCVHGGQFSGTGATVSITPSNGNTLIVGLAQQTSNNFTSLKDNGANSFTRDSASITNCSGNCQFTAFFHLSSVSGVTGVTTVFSGNTTWGLIACEVSGLNATPLDIVDNTGVGNSATTAWVTPSITTLTANDIVFGLVSNGQGNPFSSSGSWNLAATDDEGGGTFDTGMVYQAVTSATSYQPHITVTPASTGGGYSAAYKP